MFRGGSAKGLVSALHHWLYCRSQIQNFFTESANDPPRAHHLQRSAWASRPSGSSSSSWGFCSSSTRGFCRWETCDPLLWTSHSCSLTGADVAQFGAICAASDQETMRAAPSAAHWPGRALCVEPAVSVASPSDALPSTAKPRAPPPPPRQWAGPSDRILTPQRRRPALPPELTSLCRPLRFSREISSDSVPLWSDDDDRGEGDAAVFHQEAQL